MNEHGCRVSRQTPIYVGEFDAGERPVYRGIVEDERGGRTFALARRKPVGPQSPGAPEQSTPGTVAADPPYVARRPIVAGVAMTPETVTSALRMCELGYMNRWADLLSECREKVPHLQAVLSTREQAVAGCEWEVKPKDHGESARKSKKAAIVGDYVRRRLTEVAGFGDALQHLQGAIYHGRSALEIGWKRDSEGLGIEALYPIHPKRLSYAVNWRVHLWDEYGNEYAGGTLGRFPGVDLLAEYPDKFVVHTPPTMGGEIPTRQGLGRVLVWYALFWTWSQRDWMRFSELFGQPWRVAFYDKATADQDDIALIKQAIRMMSVATTAVLPSTTKFDLKMPNARAPVHESLRNALNAEISKVVLGQTLTTDTGAKGGGAFALGKVHENVAAAIKKNDGRSLSETVQKYVVEPLVRREFGEATARDYCPRFSIITKGEEDIGNEFKRFIALVDRGMMCDQDDAREHFTSLPRPEKPTPATLLIPLAQVPNAPQLPIDPNAKALPAPAAKVPPGSTPSGDGKPAEGEPGARPPKGEKEGPEVDQDQGDETADEGGGSSGGDSGGDGGGDSGDGGDEG